ncbi:hypothetical protein [uncultured Clostridium sp.]|uniref:hypothetical protein n=1 Tax=uncultured Clostridium sp. TaxID=59620 RepID=UPI002611AFF2|nr:hypothetical protein [uncultured Clostridium sp.]
MVDGNINIRLSLKAIAENLATIVGTKNTMHYDELNKTYFIEGVTEEVLLNNEFELFSRSSNNKPIYKRADILAEPNTDPSFGDIMLYKEFNNSWVGEE